MPCDNFSEKELLDSEETLNYDYDGIYTLKDSEKII